MYRSQGSMGEYFASQSGMGETSEYLQAGAGIGWMSTDWANMVRRARARNRGGPQRSVHGALVDWARQEEAEAGHRGIFGLGEFFVPGSMSGMGEYFAANGLGADAPASPDGANIGGIAYMAALGALAGLAVVGLQSKRQLEGKGVGAVTGALVGAAAGALVGVWSKTTVTTAPM